MRNMFSKGDSAYWVDDGAVIHAVTVLSDESKGAVLVQYGSKQVNASAFRMTRTAQLAKMLAARVASERSSMQSTSAANIVR